MEMKQVLDAIEAKLNEGLETYEGQLKEFGSVAEGVRAEVKTLAEEHKQLIEDVPELASRMKEVEQVIAAGVGGGEDKELAKSWGTLFTESDQFKSYGNGQAQKAGLEVKNTILGEVSSNPSNVLVPEDRMPGIVPGAFRAMTLLDFVPTGRTNSNQVEYTRELLFTNAAAETAEGASKPESTLTFELVNDPVRTIAHWLKVSKQVMDDAPALSSYIDGRLRYGVRQKVQSQVVNGNGTAPALSGLTDTGRHTAFTPTASEDGFESTNRGKYAVIASDYAPNFIMLNPADFGAMERIKSTAGEFIGGDGAGLSYINNGMTPMLWGLPVIASNEIPSGKFFCGDSSAFQLMMRDDATVEIFEQDEANVQQNLLTVHAEVRAAFCVYTPAAIQYGDLNGA